MHAKSKTTIFGNPISKKATKKAVKNRNKLASKFKHDPGDVHPLTIRDNPVMSEVLGIKNIELGAPEEPLDFQKGVVIGTIRMGYGHYRIALALASAARAKGFIPYWFDLLALKGSTAAKIIGHLNFLYALGSRISQHVELFNKYYWDPLNSEGFKKLSFNASDLEMVNLMTNVYADLPQDIPFVASHTWTAQAAVKAGLSNVINVIPDNWPMGLHLAEGAIHTVQSESSYLGYRLLREMGETGAEVLKPMPESAIQMTGHYIDHELVDNLEEDCRMRMERIKTGKPRRLLFSVGGAGAQLDTLIQIMQHVWPDIEADRVTLFINTGDHLKVLNGIFRAIPELKKKSLTYSNDLTRVKAFCDKARTEDITGIHVFSDTEIFGAVYATNYLMRESDLLITKPSELAYYPIPKLFIKRVGGHEAWGAIRGAELGDGTIECHQEALLIPTLNMLIKEDHLLTLYVKKIIQLNQMGMYHGAYHVIDIATGRSRATHLGITGKSIAEA